MKLYSFFLAIMFPVSIFAQNNDSKEAEQIIITKKGTGSEKLNIVVDGDKVTVNGDPLNKDAKDRKITVTRRKIKDIDVFNDDLAEVSPDQRRVIRRFNVSPQSIAPNKAMLGVTTQKTDNGVEVMNVTGGSAAEKAGLKQGDIITEVDHKKIETPDELSKAIGDKQPGDKVTIGYLRDGKQGSVIAELTKWNAPDVMAFGNGRNFDMQDFDVEELFRQIPDVRQFPQQKNLQRFYNVGPGNKGRKLGIRVQDLDAGSGAKVIDVQPGSNAEKAGIKEGDIIKEINGKTTLNANSVAGLVTGAKPGSNMSMKINRAGKSQTIDVNFPKTLNEEDL